MPTWHGLNEIIKEDEDKEEEEPDILSNKAPFHLVRPCGLCINCVQ